MNKDLTTAVIPVTEVGLETFSDRAPASTVIALEHIPSLPSGLKLSDPHNGITYTIQEKLGSGGEGHSYLALNEEKKRKVVKFVPAGTAIDLEQRLTEEYTRLNQIIPRDYSAFPVGLAHLVLVSDFVEGVNLDQELALRGKVYSPTETVDFLLNVVERQIKPLHQNGLVHRDLKPANIICTHTEDRVDYSIIDFGTLREHNALATVTMNLKGTPGYARFKGKYESHDDLYSLARVAYFLLTGKHPEFIAHEKYDRMHDEEVFGALPIDKRFRSVLFRMLGHDVNQRYTSIDDLVSDLQTVKRKVKDSTKSVEIDLSSARQLTQYRESAVVPLDLQRRINGIQERFKEQYLKTKRDRNPLDTEFKQDLEAVLIDLGYKPDWEYQRENGECVYLRKRKETSSIDVFVVNGGGDKYFQQYTVKSEEKISARYDPFVSDKWYSVGRAIGLAIPPAVGALGFLIAVPVGGIVFLIATGYSAITADEFYSKRNRLQNSSHSDNCSIHDGYKKYGWAPPHLFGRLFYDGAEKIKSLYRSTQKALADFDSVLLKEALQPAPFFTYDQESKKSS